MKSILKIFGLAVLFLGFGIGSYWLIFSQGLLLGILVSFLLLVVCASLLAFSLYGIQAGELEKIRLTNRMEVAGMLVLTVYLSSAVGVFAIANTAIEARELTKDFSAADKTKLLVSSLWGSGTLNAAEGTLEKNGVVYSFTASTKDEIDKIDGFLEEEKGRIADFFGNEDTGGLTIVFHDDFDTLAEMSGYEEAMGYYDFYSQEIHIVPDDYSWDVILLHEYTHYQSHLYAKRANVAETRLPSWFEEGVADYLAGESSDWYDLEDTEITDFHLLDHDYSFHNTYTRNYDPYVQSFLAVESLVNEYGEDVLKKFLPAKLPGEFYEILEDVTGMELAEFQKTFLDDMIAESKEEMAQYDAAYAAMDRKDFSEALEIIEDMKKKASEEDMNQLSWMETDLYLMQDKFDEAIEGFEKRLEENDDPESRLDDLTSLAEIYVLVDPEKSLELIEEAENLADEDGADMEFGFTYYDLEAYREAYELINSQTPLEGYEILLDEELLYYDAVIEKVTEKVEKLSDAD